MRPRVVRSSSSATRRSWVSLVSVVGVSGMAVGPGRRSIEATVRTMRAPTRGGGASPTYHLPMAPITPCIWLNGTADEAVDFWLSVFKDARILQRSTNAESAPGSRARRS